MKLISKTSSCIRPIVISCIERCRSQFLSHFDKTCVYSGHCFNIHLLGGGHCPLVRDSKPVRVLEMPMSPTLYMLINNITINNILSCIE